MLPLGLAGQLLAALIVPVGDGNGLPKLSESGMLILRGGSGGPPPAEAPPPLSRCLTQPGDTSLTVGGGSLDSSTNDWKKRRMFVLGNLKVHLQMRNKGYIQ